MVIIDACPISLPMTFRIFRSPDRNRGFDLDRGPTSREYEFLVVGPVLGILLPL